MPSKTTVGRDLDCCVCAPSFTNLIHTCPLRFLLRREFTAMERESLVFMAKLAEQAER
jgi:hypothetical protein